MLRKLVFVVCAMALTLSSCGRQVTPNRTGTSATGLASGYMQIKFNTYQAMDFGNVWYVIALNTSGTGGQPYAINGNSQQNWTDFSFEIVLYQVPGQAAPQVKLIQFISQPGIGGGTVKVPTTITAYASQLLQFTPNCNGAQTQLCVTINRTLFAGLSGSGTTPSPTPGPSSSPTSTPSASPSASPTTSPSPQPFGGTWFINWFTVNAATGQVIDAPGPSGPTDVSWLPPIPTSHNYDTTTSFDFAWQGVPPPGWVQVTPASAQIAGGEVLNNP